MESPTATAAANAFSGRINPGFRDNITAFVINPPIKVKGVEVFGTYEIAKGNSQIENGELQSTDPLQPRLKNYHNESLPNLLLMHCIALRMIECM